jgi:TolB-like protein/Flp pilus assembly protein TadD
MATVTNAIKARRNITLQSLLAVDGQPLSRRQRLRENLRLFLWIALVIGGGAILLSFFLGPKSFAPQTSRSLSPEITAPEKSIAVLPFESLSDNKSDTYFADGVQDEILSNLAKVSQLRVISRTSVMTFRPGGNRDLRSIATALEVAHVLEGTVRRNGNRVRITTELIDARTDKTLWSDSYDRDLTDIFDVQSEIAQTVVAKLNARLSPEEKQGMQEKLTQNSEAYDLYLQAKTSITNSLLSNYVGEERPNYLYAIALLEQATRMDSTFALAYCQIAKADDWLYVTNLDDTPERRAHGDAAVNRALQLKPNLPEVRLTAAFHFYICYRNYQKARVYIARTEQDLPNSADALALSGYLDRRQGRWSDSTKALERACNLDPKNPEILNQLGGTYDYLRQYRDEEKIYDRLIALESDKPSLQVQKACISLSEKAELTALREALEDLPPSIRYNEANVSLFLDVLFCAREWTTARALVKSESMEEMTFGFGHNAPTVPRMCLEIPIARYQGEHPEMNAELGAARNRLLEKVAGHPKDPKLLSAIGLVDAYLGRKEEAMQEAKRAVDILPVSEDAVDAPGLVDNLAAVYALTNEPDLALRALDVSIETPGGMTYGSLKLDPAWDSLRSDPRFDKLLAQLAPR